MSTSGDEDEFPAGPAKDHLTLWTINGEDKRTSLLYTVQDHIAGSL
jgi:hypothetical protein